MTQPPQQPGDQPWQDPHRQPGPYGPPYGQPPPYGGQQPYGYGGVPGYPGGQSGYLDPATGLASRWARLGAALIDGLLLGLATTLVSLPFVDWGRLLSPDPGRTDVPAGQWVIGLVSALLGLLYYWLMHARRGQTIGKRLLGIRVVREVDRGAIDNSQALLRAAIYSVLGGLCGCFGLFNVAWILWDPRRQALHDKAARTVVERTDVRPDPYAAR